MKNQLTLFLIKTIKYLKIDITTSSIVEQLEEHPSFPSLLAISDVLNFWNINNESYNLEVSHLKQLKVPYIVHLDGFKVPLVLVKYVDATSVCFVGDNYQEETIPISDFESVFTGNTIILEYGKLSGEIGYKDKKRQEIIESVRLPAFFSMVGITIIVSLCLNNSLLNAFNWQIRLLLLAKLIGLFASIMLLIQSIDANNPLVSRFCRGKKNINCDSILSSKASKIPGMEISWSEVGFFYFSGTFLFLIFNSDILGTLQVLTALNILCLPYTFYSIYFQSRVVKQWCILCCIVQASLWIEFSSLIFYFPSLYDAFNVRNILKFIVSGMIPIAAWIFLRPYFSLSQQVSPLNRQLKKFKYNKELFENLLKSGRHYDLLKDNESIILGDPYSNNIITIVSNPHCQPCAKLHKIAESWVSIKGGIKLQIILAPNLQEGRKFTSHILSYDLNKDRERVAVALSNWFNDERRNFEEWNNKYLGDQNDNGEKLLKKHREWCNIIELEYTPTILVNGYKLPESYSFDDIKFLL